MGLFGKLVESSKENAIYRLVKKNLVADGKEHTVMKGMALLTDKMINGFAEDMASNGYEVVSLDIQEHPNPKMKMVKIVYKSV